MDARHVATPTEKTIYLVERYWPGIDDASLDAALRRLESAARDAGPIEHLGSFLVEADQVVFSVMRARSETLVREVNERARMPVDRVAPVSPHGFEALGREAARERT
jgi:hypothetical protein